MALDDTAICQAAALARWGRQLRRGRRSDESAAETKAGYNSTIISKGELLSSFQVRTGVDVGVANRNSVADSSPGVKPPSKVAGLKPTDDHPAGRPVPLQLLTTGEAAPDQALLA